MQVNIELLKKINLRMQAAWDERINLVSGRGVTAAEDYLYIKYVAETGMDGESYGLAQAIMINYEELMLYNVRQRRMTDPTFNAGSSELGKIVEGWIKEKRQKGA